MKYKIYAIQGMRFNEIVVEAKSEEEAKEIYNAKWNNGIEIYSVDYEEDYVRYVVELIEPKPPIKRLWEEFGNVPVNNDDETEQDFYHFEKGTPREEVWHWFEEIDPTFSVGKMINYPKS